LYIQKKGVEIKMKKQEKSSRISLGTKKKKLVGKIVVFIVLSCISVMMLFPIYIMVVTSLKTSSEVLAFPPTLIPKKIVFENFGEVFELLNFATLYKNSLTISLLVTLGTVLSSSFVAFGFYRYKAPGKKALFIIVLSTMMIPYAAYMIPQFILFMNISWVNTFLPLIVPAFFGTAYSIFLFRQFYGTIPYDLFEAARIDGASEIRCWGMMLRLCGAALAAVAILTFIQSWDDLLGPVIYLSENDKYTLPIGLSSFRSKFKIIPWHQIMAAALMVCIPNLLLFTICQKYFVEGIAFSGLKT
jgi:multiple sugar transport system permease protein